MCNLNFPILLKRIEPIPPSGNWTGNWTEKGLPFISIVWEEQYLMKRTFKMMSGDSAALFGVWFCWNDTS